MKHFAVTGVALLALGSVGLVSCEDVSRQLDPLSVDARGGDSTALDYDTLMRIGAAARSAGDFSNAVSLYRRAASIKMESPAPFVAMGNALLEMSQWHESLIAYNAAIDRDSRDPEALRGLAKTYLHTGRPELAARALAIAYEDAPNDPKLLQLIGVADDFMGQHSEAQARYRRGIELAPEEPDLTLNLALSLALTGNYDESIMRLKPIALAANGTPRARQTLALIFGLKGDARAAEELGRIDLEPSAVKHNLAYYESLRRLSPEARSAAIQKLGMSDRGN